MTFDIDANGLVHVSAKDLGTGKEQSMTITGGSALPKDDIESMIKDAEAHAEEDAKRRERVELLNQADQLVWQTEKSLNEYGEKVDAGVRADIEQALGDLKEAMQGDDPDADVVKEKMSSLAEKSQQLAQAIYQAEDGPGAGAAPGGDPAQAAVDDDVVDAEIIDEGDDQDASDS